MVNVRSVSKGLTSLFIFIVLPTLLFSQNNLSMHQLKQRVIDTLAAQKGFFAVALKDLSTGRELLINEHENLILPQFAAELELPFSFRVRECVRKVRSKVPQN